ncbi:hypothetical protein Naga_100059g25 [Nannochloropsis gaditana]|uniref:Uncharacterized protein n=1 Tax=Nannochloropsis gaditana TaxID=72520 RepID=W7U4J4_9STRA|nr:hypothetical protein Naga_100059g25 [Nannochloropsis gaditana]
MPPPCPISLLSVNIMPKSPRECASELNVGNGPGVAFIKDDRKDACWELLPLKDTDSQRVVGLRAVIVDSPFLSPFSGEGYESSEASQIELWHSSMNVA